MNLRHGQAAEEPSTSTDSTTDTTSTGNATSTANTGGAVNTGGTANTSSTDSSTTNTSSTAATEYGQQPPSPATAPPADVGYALDEVGQSALRLLSGLPRPPSALSIEANGVSIQIEWAAGPPAAPGPTPEHGQPPAGDQAVPSTLTQPVPADSGRSASGDSRPASDTGGGTDAGSSRHYLRSPAVGVLFRAPSPGAKPFVEVGDSVVSGQQVAIVEVMKLMIPVEADTDGRVVEVLKENAEPVEYDEPLFAIAPLSN